MYPFFILDPGHVPGSLCKTRYKKSEAKSEAPVSYLNHTVDQKGDNLVEAKAQAIAYCIFQKAQSHIIYGQQILRICMHIPLKYTRMMYEYMN